MSWWASLSGREGGMWSCYQLQQSLKTPNPVWFFSHISAIKTFMVFQSQFDGKSQILLYFSERGIVSLKDTTAKCFIFQRAGKVKGMASSYFFCDTAESLMGRCSRWLLCLMFRCQWQVTHSMSREDLQRKPRSSHSYISVSLHHSPISTQPPTLRPPEGSISQIKNKKF